MHFSTIAILALCNSLAPAATASQEMKRSPNAKFDIGHEMLKAAFGPKETWPRQMAIDILPADATLEGKPVTENDVFSYGPFNVNATHRELMRRRGAEVMGTSDIFEKKSLTKRCDEGNVNAAYKCYSGSNWVSTPQIQGGAASFCNDHRSMPSRQAVGQGKQYYLVPGTTNSYNLFKNSAGQKVGVYYEVTQWAEFNWDNCWNALSQSGWLCKGSNEDTAGGWNGWVSCDTGGSAKREAGEESKRGELQQRQDVRWFATYGYKPTWLNSYDNVNVVPYS